LKTQAVFNINLVALWLADFFLAEQEDQNISSSIVKTAFQSERWKSGL
jgi:hypothetical protein